MDPDFGLGIGQEASGNGPPRRRPTPLLRGMEMAGLALVIYGLGSYRFGLVAIGGVMIVGSYALYRRKYGPALPTGSSDGSGGPNLDGGGD
jgi:hypothetical protein